MYLAHYLYVAPDGTFDAETENRPVQTNAIVVPILGDAIDFIRDHFDGVETFDEHFVPDIMGTLESKDVYCGDDYSAGQWFTIIRVHPTHGCIESAMS